MTTASHSANLILECNPSKRRPLVAFFCSILVIIIVYEMLLPFFGTSVLLEDLTLLACLFPVFVLIRDVILHSYFITYRLFEDHLEKEEGIVAREIQKASLERVTNFVLRQTAIQRVLGVCSVLVSTAGSDGYEFYFRDMTVSQGRALIDRLTHIVHASESYA